MRIFAPSFCLRIHEVNTSFLGFPLPSYILKDWSDLMFRCDWWPDGVFVDNHAKCECLDCNGEFIIGTNTLKRQDISIASCPYCGGENTEPFAYQDEEDELERLRDAMGDLAIFYEE